MVALYTRMRFPSTLGRQLDRETKERWLVLCEEAAEEQDASRLLALVTEINRLLDEKRERVRQKSERISNNS
jgi:hypothetical protein